MSRKLLNGLRRCSKCGRRVLMQGYGVYDRVGHMMNTRQMCYDCAYWTDLMEYPSPSLEVVDGRCFKILPFVAERDPTCILGGKGKVHYFLRPDFTVFKSNDIWLIGQPPERFRSHFQNTVREITRIAYERIVRNPNKCRARACFDRYNCYRYDIALEAGNPFNQIPKNWKVGNERCTSFLNINTMFTIKKPIYESKSTSDS